MSHTPGPWEAERDCTRDFGYQITRDKGRQIIAETICTGHEANARLIAAAPDLLEAAKWIVNCVNTAKETGVSPTECFHGNWDVLGEKLIKAIAKAEGKE